MILTNYQGNDQIKKCAILKASEWVLTPYHKIFNGRNFQLIISNRGWLNVKEKINNPISNLEKLAWGVLAVIIAPFAAVAAIFKYFISLSAGSVNSPHELKITELTDIPFALDPFLKAKISGYVKINYVLRDDLLLPENVPNNIESSKALSVRVKKIFESSKVKGNFDAVNVFDVPDKPHRSATFHCNLRGFKLYTQTTSSFGF